MRQRTGNQCSWRSRGVTPRLCEPTWIEQSLSRSFFRFTRDPNQMKSVFSVFNCNRWDGHHRATSAMQCNKRDRSTSMSLSWQLLHSVVSITMSLHVILVQHVHFGVGFKPVRSKNRTLGHAAVNGETGRRSFGIADRLSAVVEVALTPIKHSVSPREPLRQNWYKYIASGRRCQTLHWGPTVPLSVAQTRSLWDLIKRRFQLNGKGGMQIAAIQHPSLAVTSQCDRSFACWFNNFFTKDYKKIHFVWLLRVRPVLVSVQAKRVTSLVRLAGGEVTVLRGISGTDKSSRCEI